MDGTIAEIRMFAGNFAPRGWLFCNGQLLSIASSTAFFALVGTTFGGNGITTFGVPDFRGRLAVGTGNGPGLPGVVLGESSGLMNSTLNTNNLPFHNHTITGTIIPQATTNGALVIAATGNRIGPGAFYSDNVSDLANLPPAPNNLSTSLAGSGQPISIMQPYLGMNYIICQEGIFPSRN